VSKKLGLALALICVLSFGGLTFAQNNSNMSGGNMGGSTKAGKKSGKRKGRKKGKKKKWGKKGKKKASANTATANK
jgi:hypothetical protein